MITLDALNELTGLQHGFLTGTAASARGSMPRSIAVLFP